MMVLVTKMIAVCIVAAAPALGIDVLSLSNRSAVLRAAIGVNETNLELELAGKTIDIQLAKMFKNKFNVDLDGWSSPRRPARANLEKYVNGHDDWKKLTGGYHNPRMWTPAGEFTNFPKDKKNGWYTGALKFHSAICVDKDACAVVDGKLSASQENDALSWGIKPAPHTPTVGIKGAPALRIGQGANGDSTAVPPRASWHWYIPAPMMLPGEGLYLGSSVYKADQYCGIPEDKHGNPKTRNGIPITGDEKLDKRLESRGLPDITVAPGYLLAGHADPELIEGGFCYMIILAIEEHDQWCYVNSNIKPYACVGGEDVTTSDILYRPAATPIGGHDFSVNPRFSHQEVLVRRARAGPPALKPAYIVKYERLPAELCFIGDTYQSDFAPGQCELKSRCLSDCKSMFNPDERCIYSDRRGGCVPKTIKAGTAPPPKPKKPKKPKKTKEIEETNDSDERPKKSAKKPNYGVIV